MDRVDKIRVYVFCASLMHDDLKSHDQALFCCSSFESHIHAQEYLNLYYYLNSIAYYYSRVFYLSPNLYSFFSRASTFT